jgi:sugar phosphate isomerase/epimerase
MLLGYNSNGLAHHRLDEAIGLLADQGFKVLALTPDTCHLDPYRSQPRDWEQIQRLMQKHHMSCVIETGARFILDPRTKHRPNLLEENKEERNRRLDYLSRCLEIGNCLGAKVLSLWAGVLPQGVPQKTGEDRLTEGLDRLLHLAHSFGIKLALEPEPGMLIQTIAEAKAVLSRMGKPEGLGICVDIGHLFVTGEAGEGGRNTEIILKSVKSQLLQVHLEDIREGIHEHLPPGEGDLDFDQVWRGLRSIQYQGPVCFELSRSSHEAPKQLQNIRSLFARVFSGS